MERRMGLVRQPGRTVLSLRGLAREYRDSWGRRTTALRDVTLDVEPGEVLGLLGPNGAGKSTTFKIVLGFVRPTGGTGTLLGEPLGSAGARRRVGFLPESPWFYDYLTAPEFLDTCAALCGVPARDRRRTIAATLDRVGLDPGERRRLRKFSKGMLQRVGFAQAMLHDPDFLILDEPMSGLDPVGRRQFRDLILALREEGKTVLFASHVLPDVEALCDRVGILVNGTLSRVGRLDELIPPPSGYEIEAGGLAPALAESWSRSGAGRRGGDRLIVAVESTAEMERAVRRIYDGGGTVHAIRPVQGSLESVLLTEMNRARGGDAAFPAATPRRGAA